MHHHRFKNRKPSLIASLHNHQFSWTGRICTAIVLLESITWQAQTNPAYPPQRETCVWHYCRERPQNTEYCSFDYSFKRSICARLKWRQLVTSKLLQLMNGLHLQLYMYEKITKRFSKSSYPQLMNNYCTALLQIITRLLKKTYYKSKAK